MMIHHRNKNKRLNIFFSSILILVLIFSLVHIVFPQNITRYILFPFYKVKEVASIPFSGLITNFKSKKSLEERVAFLEEENSKLKISLLTQSFVNTQIEDYNSELEKKSNGMISKVLNRPPFSPYDTLLILKGDHNIEVGDVVFIKGVYIGEIESVDAYTAVVKMRSSSGYKTLVRVSDLETEAEGKGGGQFYIKVPKDSSVKVGDAVMYPGFDYVLLGSVGQVIEDPVATFKTVYFSIPVSFQEMNFVSVVKKDSVLE